MTIAKYKYNQVQRLKQRIEVLESSAKRLQKEVDRLRSKNKELRSELTIVLEWIKLRYSLEGMHHQTVITPQQLLQNVQSTLKRIGEE
jgi:predicted RNase H-like nuclease (RuvC/YqgF family)